MNNPLASQLMYYNQMFSPLLAMNQAPLQAPQMIHPQVPFVPFNAKAAATNQQNAQQDMSNLFGVGTPLRGGTLADLIQQLMLNQNMANELPYNNA